MDIAACFSSSAGLAARFGCLYDHIPLHAHIHINGYGSFLGFRGTSRGSRAVVAGGSASASAKKLAVNGYAGPSSSTSRLTYTWTDSCLVIPPPAGKKPRAIVKFLGGAFIGAVPELTYSYLTELLAKDGFLVISVPYNVTFDHVQAARQVYERFNGCLDNILASGLPNSNLSAAQLAQLPVFSVGHSNGALIQVLAGSYFSDKVPKANAIIAYNNRPATEAVPYFEQLGPLVNQMVPIIEASPISSVARTASGGAWKAPIGAAGAMLPDNQETLSSVAQGISEFKPTPSENRDFCKSSYNVKHTLLPRVESIGGTLERVEISGNHITPCVQEPKWQAGYVYTPADAIAQSLKTLSLNDVRVLSRTISDWFRGFED